MMAGVGTRFLLVYASQTGQAQAIAEEIAEKAPQHGLTVEMHCMSLTEKKVRERGEGFSEIGRNIVPDSNTQ